MPALKIKNFCYNLLILARKEFFRNPSEIFATNHYRKNRFYIDIYALLKLF